MKLPTAKALLVKSLLILPTPYQIAVRHVQLSERMLELGDRIDELAAQRAGALAELAKIRRVPLMQLMDDLGIYGAGVRLGYG